MVIAGGGAAGFFAAITAAELSPGCRIRILEKSPQFLSKVRISGGGRCNVTHACFDVEVLCGFYPRGAAALRGPFRQFQPRDTMAWFEQRGVKLKIESDGRVFPASDSSASIVDCLMESARRAGVEWVPNCAVESAVRRSEGGFDLVLGRGESASCRKLMLATGGCRSAALGRVAESLGHHLEPPVPSLFTFHVAVPWLRELAGISVPDVECAVPGTKLKERGPILVTHQGFSGPSVLRLSAWGARILHERNYRFALRINWLPRLARAALESDLANLRSRQAARKISNSPPAGLPGRLWKGLLFASGISPELRWAGLSRSDQHGLVERLTRMELQVDGRSLNQDEFVTCGGVRLGEVDFKTMESRLCPGLYFGGELLDIDGVTGGFNFQSAWTTGWLAGRALAAES